MATLYAWSPIKAGTKSANAGDVVTADKLGLNKDEFEQLVDAGAVREEKYPKLPEGYTGSAAEYAALPESEKDNGTSES